jgi:hypothetical protein
VRPGNNATAIVKETYQKALEIWQERKDTCISFIYESVAGNGEALEIVDIFWRKKCFQQMILQKRL